MIPYCDLGSSSAAGGVRLLRQGLCKCKFRVLVVAARIRRSSGVDLRTTSLTLTNFMFCNMFAGKEGCPDFPLHRVREEFRGRKSI